MANKAVKIYIIFVLMALFFIYTYLFPEPEGFYGYNQQWNSELGEWTPCANYFYSVPLSEYSKKCCSIDSVWDESVSLCHPECTGDKIWNKKISSCVDPSTRCPKGFSTYKGNGKCGVLGFTNDVDSNF
jgi:hypothetical protein